MKKGTITMLIILIHNFHAWGQEQLQDPTDESLRVLVIDYNHPDRNGIFLQRDYNKLKNGQFFKVRIKNINTYLYNVEINNEDIDTTKNLPTNFLSLLDLGGLAASLQNLNSISSIINKIEPKDSIQEIAFNPTVLINMETLEDSRFESNSDLKVKLESIKLSYKEKYESVRNLYVQIEEYYIEVEQYPKAILKIKKDNILKDKVLVKKKINSLFKKFNDHKKDIILKAISLKEEHTNFSAINEAHKDAIDQDVKLKILASEIKSLYQAMVSTLENLEKQFSAEKYAILSQGLTDIINNLNFTHTSLPIQHYKDVNKLDITITPRNDKAKLSSYKITLRIPDYEKSFWGVSTGFYITKNLEENYSIKERATESGTVYDLIKEDQSKEELGINTMVRTGWNLGFKNKNWFVQTGFGAGLTLKEKVKPRLMIGGGLAYGSKNKIFLDIGLIYQFYDKLAKAYDLTDNKTLPENFMSTSTQLRNYISLGYLIKL